VKNGKIVIASHGTPGARAAETAALRLAARRGASLVHLYVVPDFWRGMRGDDWLNNAITQQAFGDYVENELAREAAREMNRLATAAHEAGVPLAARAMFGKPAECLLRVCEEENARLAVIGAPRRKGEPGYNSRMKLEPLARGLGARLLIVPRNS